MISRRVVSAAGLILLGEEQVRSPSIEDCPRLVDQLNDEEKRRINDGIAQSPPTNFPTPPTTTSNLAQHFLLHIFSPTFLMIYPNFMKVERRT